MHVGCCGKTLKDDRTGLLGRKTYRGKVEERFSYDNFVLPFTAGMVFILIYFAVALGKIIRDLPWDDRKRFFRSIFSYRIFISGWEIIRECLLHVKIFKRNKTLGFMHMSIAFGWFMMIVLAHIEVKLYAPHRFNLPYFPIFFRYFMKETEHTMQGAFFFFLMDFFLLLVLIGVGMAVFKRFNSRAMGMRRTTRLKMPDRIAVYTLWLIFPLRLLAESYTAGIAGGSFLTDTVGHIVGAAPEIMGRGFWWAYSIALGLFFFCLPFSRFMHIPTEALLILFRNAGIRSKKKGDGYATTEVYSCSRCGICIDACQISSAARVPKDTSVYFIRELREKDPKALLAAENCLMCGRCVEACPVGIDSVRLRQNVKELKAPKNQGDFSYVPPMDVEKADVLYFAGCMTRTMPSIERSMLAILDASGDNYTYMDKSGTICCGRPMLLTGQVDAARAMIDKNKEIIKRSGAKTLVTSCPICFKVFNEQYGLDIEILHHTQYIDRLISSGRIKVEHSDVNAVYHDPCDLGRGSKVYDAPRRVVSAVAELSDIKDSKRMSLCCGGSLANTVLNEKQRRDITLDAYGRLTAGGPDVLVTACPLCKKTFAGVSAGKVPVEDIAQTVVRNMSVSTAGDARHDSRVASGAH